MRSTLRRVVAWAALTSGCQAPAPEAVPLWPAGAPGAEGRSTEAEVQKDWWVKNVHRPSLTVVRPARPSRAAVIILPGGGHERLVFGPEGLAPAKFFAERGVSAFVLKYRLAREAGSPYSVEGHAAADAARAVRWVRHHAEEYGLDPKQVGMMGWSAGGELAALVTFGDAAVQSTSQDPIDKLNSRPDFLISVYPGPLGLPEAVSATAPPAFLLAAGDDLEAARVVTRLLELYQAAGASAELHLFAQGGHGFNMGDRSELPGIRAWPARLEDWLSSQRLGRK